MLNAPTITTEKIAERTNFIICNECFWCASSLDNESTIEACPSCSKNAIEAIPIFNNERYAFDYNTSTGVTRTFHGKARKRLAAFRQHRR